MKDRIQYSIFCRICHAFWRKKAKKYVKFFLYIAKGASFAQDT